MAEFSRPQPGLFPADGNDCGAYTANEWAPVLIAGNRSSGMMVTGAASPPGLPATQLFPNVGVFYSVADRLVVSSPGASQITIGTGASIVDGRVHTNDDEHTAIAVTNPGANPRIDRVVVRQNYTVADYTSVNAPALVVNFNTARICIISGAENVTPVAPTLTQDEDRVTYWDIPLAQYQIAVGGAITNLTDEREWVDAETKRFWVPAIAGWNNTDGTNLEPRGSASCGPYLYFQDNKISIAYGRFAVASDYISDYSITGVSFGGFAGGGNIYARQIINAAACTESFITHQTTGAWAAEAMAAALFDYSCLRQISPAGITLGDIVQIQFERDATDVLDTIGDDTSFLGWIVTYLGWGRR